MFKAWVVSQNLIVPVDPATGRCDQTYVTHLNMSGGRNGNLKIPVEQNNKLCELLAGDIIGSNKNSIVEMRPEIFKFFMDIDLKFDKADLAMYRSIIEVLVGKICVNLIERYYGSERVKIIRLDAPESEEKIGVHLYFSEIIVNQHIAVFLRRRIIEQCRIEFQPQYGHRMNLDKFEDIIDNRIYNKNGIRMLGQIKPLRISKEERAYRFKKLYYVSGPQMDVEHMVECSMMEERLGSDFIYALKETSMRCANTMPPRAYSATDITSFYPNALSEDDEVFLSDPNHIGEELLIPNSSAANAMNNKKKNNKVGLTKVTKAPANNNNINNNDDNEETRGATTVTSSSAVVAEKFQKKSEEIVPAKSSVFSNLCRYIMNIFPFMVGPRDFDKLIRTVDQRGSFCYLMKSWCKYCPNKNGEHGKNNIYFIISHSGIILRCYSTSVPAGSHVSCKAYKSEPHPIPRPIALLLFPYRFDANTKKELRKGSVFISQKEFVMKDESSNSSSSNSNSNILSGSVTSSPSSGSVIISEQPRTVDVSVLSMNQSALRPGSSMYHDYIANLDALISKNK